MFCQRKGGSAAEEPAGRAACSTSHFALSKPDWLERHKNGALRYETFALDELELRTYPDAVVATARQKGPGIYNGHPVPGELRVTLVLSHASSASQLAVVHMSFIAGTPGAPPIPGRPQPEGSVGG